jgi:hypothetical protein
MPASGLPLAKQASSSPQDGSVFVTDSHPAPSAPGPDFMQEKFLPSSAQQVWPAGQSYCTLQGAVPDPLEPQAQSRTAQRPGTA